MIVEVDELTRYAARQEVKRFIQYIRNRSALHAAEPDRKQRAAPGSIHRIVEWMRAQPEMVTMNQIAEALDLSIQTVRNAMSRHRDRFVFELLPKDTKRMGPPRKLWKVVG